MHVGILVFEGADPLDVIGPYRVFAAVGEVRGVVDDLPDVHVHLVDEHLDPTTLDFGVTIVPSTTFSDCPPLDVLVVPGGGSNRDGGGRRSAQRHPPTLEFIRRQAARAEITASVCTGAFVLAEAGLLAVRRANTHWFWRDELVALMRERGEDFTLVADRVVDDAGLVTAGGVSSGIDLALYILGRLLGEDAERAVRFAIESETPP